MEYKNFMRLMQSQEHCGTETVSALQEMLSEFPYFQSAHILLAKCMKEQEHLRFERQLKLAATYAPDRSVLYSMLHTKNKAGIVQKTVTEETVSPFTMEKELEEESLPLIVESENPFIDTGVPVTEMEPIVFPEEEISVEGSTEIPEPRYALDAEEPVRPETSTTHVASASHETLSSDPREVLRRRLAEILGNPDEDSSPTETIPEDSPKKESPVPTVQNSIVEDKETQESAFHAEELQPENAGSETAFPAGTTQNETTDVIPEDLSVPMDTVEKMELEYALENSILASIENLPLIDKVEPVASSIEKTEDTLLSTFQASNEDLPHKRMEFFAWLKNMSTGNFGEFEEIHADDDTAPSSIEKKSERETSREKSIAESNQSGPPIPLSELVHQDPSRDLIEKFIATEPKIIPSKAEFYSPVTQAKRSVEEHDDLVSETLAGIYKKQGNLFKARHCYEKLSLFYPGKSTYFAALINEIDEELNKLNKEDL